MSIATLKKKTQSQYNNSSVGQKQFSINGTLRNQGYVGQTMLSRSLPKTLAKGGSLRGVGGCCGTFIVHPVVQSGINYFNNPNIVKPSVKNTRGMIQEKYKWVNRPEPFSSVKPKINTISSQSDRIKKLHNSTIAAFNDKKCNLNVKPPYSCKSCILSNNYNYVPTKPYGDPSKTAINSSSDFIENKLTQNCTLHDASNNVISRCRTAFACGNSSTNEIKIRV